MYRFTSAVLTIGLVILSDTPDNKCSDDHDGNPAVLAQVLLYLHHPGSYLLGGLCLLAKAKYVITLSAMAGST